MTFGPWLSTVTSSVGVSSAAVVDRSRHTRVGSSSRVSASLSRISVSVAPAAIDGSVHTTSSAARVRVVPAGATAPVKPVPRGAVTVTTEPTAGVAPSLVSRIREG